MTEKFDPYRKWLGIPPQDQPPHHYRLLGIDPFESDPDVIETAADGRMSLLKTFATGPYSAESQRLLNEIAAAKVCLLSPERKADYDRKLKVRLQAEREGLHAPAVPARRPAPGAGLEQARPVVQIDPSAIVSSVASRGRRSRSMRVPLAIAAVVVLAGAVLGVLWVTGAIDSLVARRAPVPAEQPKATPAKPATPAAATRAPTPAAEPKPAQPAPMPEEQPKSGVQPPEPSPAEPQPPALPPDRTPEKTTPESGVPSPEPDLPNPALDQERTLADLLDPVPPPGPAPPGPAEAAPGAPGSQPAAQPATQPSQPGKQAVPDKAARQQAEKKVREIFQKEFAEANTAEKQAALAAKLVAQARETSDDPAARFALLEMACRMMADAAQLGPAMEVADQMQQSYQVDALAIKAFLLDRLGKSPQIGAAGAANYQQVVESAMQLIDEAAAADNFAMAAQFARLGANTARKVKDGTLLRQVSARSQELERQKQAFATAEKALAALAQNAADPGANLTAGRWYCFQTGNWEKGLPMLVQGNDPVLAQLAKLDLGSPKTAPQQTVLADEWLKLANEQPSHVKRAIQSRAAYWYQRALPGLTGLEKTRVEKALEGIAAAEEPLGAKTTGVVKPGNVALVSNGTKVTGVEKGGEFLIDGNSTDYADSALAMGTWPCEWIVTFDKVYRLQEIRLKLWDMSKRVYRYGLAISPDGIHYTTLVDPQQGQGIGWQRVTFRARPVKTIKLIGVSNSANNRFHVMELEAYCNPPPAPPK